MIINKSFKKAEVPHQLKKANVSPIIKNKDLDPENLKNYHPISNIPFIAKVLEKAVFYQVNKHLQKHGFYSLNQSGCRKNLSCETTLLKIVDDLQKTIHIDNLLAVLMLDLSAAFDTIDQWFSTFLLERNPHETFQRLEEPLCNNLIVLCNKHHLIEMRPTSN